MKTVIRNSYTPQIGDYCDTVVVDRESGIKYIFDCDGVFTEWSRGKTITSLDDYREKYKDTDVFSTGGTLDAIDYYVGEEAAAREAADEELEQEIEDLRNNPDVVDIVGTYADLQSYDTSDLGDNDIIKVLQDETKNNATTYYKWHITSQTWEYIGEQGPFYTKSEADATFVPQTRTVNNKALSSNITLTAADVGALPDSTVIPIVNNAILTIQKNGTNVQTFTANQATNATANITVPVNTSDLNNDGDGQSPFATEDYVDTYGGKIDTIEVNGTAQPIVNKTVDITVPTKTSDLTNDGSDGSSTYVEADDLATVATSGDYYDLINLPVAVVDFTGATASIAGAHGLVPAPAAGDQDKYLKGDGTWATVQSGQDALIIREWS